MSTSTLLIIDDNDADRIELANNVKGSVATVHSAANLDEASQIAANASVSAIIAAIPEVNGESIFEFRDNLATKQGSPIPSVFCSRTDMAAYYSKVLPTDKLFFKPIEIPILKEWLGTHVGPPPIPASEPKSSGSSSGKSIEITDYDEDLPIGTLLGDYRLDKIIQRDENFALYEAEQTSINRKVAIKTLYRKHRRDPEWVQAFVSEASARARVNHSSVSLVYECIQETGVNFYTLELVDAPSLSDLANQRESISDGILWDILEACCSALEYFRSNQMHHRMLTSHTVLLQNGEQTRIANPVKAAGSTLTPDEESQQIQELRSAFQPFVQKGKTESALYALIDRLGADRIDGIKTIDGLRRGLNADAVAKKQGAVAEGAPPPPVDRMAELKKREENKKVVVLGVLTGALLVVGGLVAMLFLKKPPKVKEFREYAEVRSGPFPYQENETIELPTFYMAKQEVTIAQYAEFLEDVESKPTTLAALQHPDQPEEKKSHKPDRWEVMLKAAMNGKKFLNLSKIDPNFPVTGVDWWDAYAYARWKNGRLPTEQEWEKAARGRSGDKYPWGNELDTSKFNSGVDQKKIEGQKAGSIDGYIYWSPVDALGSDISRFGVTNLAGNVSEWTSSWGAHPDNPSQMVPIKRGASFGIKRGFESTIRRAAETPEESTHFLGFRTVFDVDPNSPAFQAYRPPPHKPITALASSSGRKGKGRPKGKGKGGMGPGPEPSTPSTFEWDPADGVDPFGTIFATDS